MLPLPFPCRNLTNQKQYITNEEKNQEIGGKKPPPAKKSYRRGQERRGEAPCIPAPEPRRHLLDLPLWKTQWGLAPRGTGSTCQSGTRRGAQGGGRPPTLPLRCLQGGLPALSPAYAAFSLLFCPYPPSPLPLRGRGGTSGYFYARGFAPCIPTPEPARHRFALPLWKTQWGLAPRGTGSTCQSGTRRGAQGGGRLPTLPLVLLLSPSPRPPFPSGEGGASGYFYARGFAPCIPGAEPTARRKTDRKRFPTRVPPGFNRRRACLPGTVSAASGLMPGVPGAEPPAKST